MAVPAFFLVMVSPDGEMPMELERDVVVLDFPLPTRDELKTILDDLVAGTGIQPDDENAVLDAAQGLTWSEAEDALSLALVRQKRFDPKTITELKAQMVKKAAALEYSSFTETFQTLGGLDNLKSWTLGRFRLRRPGLPFRGILLLGVPGTGKSHFAKTHSLFERSITCGISVSHGAPRTNLPKESSHLSSTSIFMMVEFTIILEPNRYSTAVNKYRKMKSISY
ncbi:MAG: hypothetical protein ACYC6G_17280 [Desulfobaccales bacterium]